MQNHAALLSAMPLFRGIDPADLDALLHCVDASVARYPKGSFISLVGDTINAIGIVLSGRVHILKEDVFGNRAILNNVEPGSVFGESFICGGNFSLTVSIQAAEDTSVLFLSFDKVIHSCSNACEFHNTLIKNMMVMLAQKNIKLVEKLEVTTKHSLREKVLTYLSQLAQDQKSSTVRSPLGRVDLADFLGVDRSALTRELNRMEKDGLITYDKNTFHLSGHLHGL
ncbi:Crp/Fnr family transcriptional regulator [Clostridia bacterium OttesenSCG-928-O13]|nr:Crp/Fnr family transcriptional regulator [Clostridia bacterium OttesenSCG-928-O13]